MTRREGLLEFGVRVYQRRPPAARNNAQFGIVALDRFNVIAPGNGDPVLGSFELRLEGEEVLVCLEVRITFYDQ